VRTRHPLAAEALTTTWQVKGQRDIVVHNSLPLLDYCAASVTGIMPHIYITDYFRLTVPANEVIE
jgi:hypothetical protein